MTDTMSVKKAAAEYGVPRSTLHEKVTGKAALRVKSGSKNHLTDEEGARLVEFLISVSSIGYSSPESPEKLSWLLHSRFWVHINRM